MAMTSIYGGNAVTFGGAMNMETGLGFVFLSKTDFASRVPAPGVDAAAMLKSLITSEPGIQGLIVQQLSLRADRPLSTFYDISSSCVYYVAGKSTVVMSLDRIVGPKGLILDWYSKFGDPCNAYWNYMTFDLSKSACDETGTAVTSNGNILVAANCVLMQVAISVSVQNFVITEAGQVQGSQLAVETS
jgi:hypothetical protein